MQDDKNVHPQKTDSTEPSSQPESRQEQTDPQLTELRGFVNPKEDLEPTLTDGTKSPDKSLEEFEQEKDTNK